MINDIKTLKEFLVFYEVHGNNINGLCYYYGSFLGYYLGSPRKIFFDYPSMFEFAKKVTTESDIYRSSYWFKGKAERIAFLKAFILHLEKNPND